MTPLFLAAIGFRSAVILRHESPTDLLSYATPNKSPNNVFFVSKVDRQSLVRLALTGQ